MQHVGSVAARAEQVAADLQTSCIGLRVGRLNRVVGRRFDQALRPLGLSVAQMEILGCLTMNEEPLRPADLAAWLAVERSTMSRNLTLMEERGYICATSLSPTGRTQRVTITGEGMAALAGAQQAWRHTQDAVARDLGSDAVTVLDTWLSANFRRSQCTPAVDRPLGSTHSRAERVGGK